MTDIAPLEAAVLTSEAIEATSPKILKRASASVEPQAEPLLPSTEKSEVDQSGKKDPNGKDEGPKPKVPMLSLWRYANKLEKTYIAIAIFSSIACGALVPAVILVLGNILNTGGSGQLTADAMLPYILDFVWFAIAIFISSYVATALFTWTAETQGRRIREMYVQSLLFQEIGWHDANTTSHIARLAIDTQNITEGLGEKSGMIIESATSGITGIVIALVKGWKLTLVMLAVTPIMGLAGVLMLMALKRVTSRSQEVYASAGAIAEQALSSIKTVAAFSMQSRFIKRYDDKLSQAFEVECSKGSTIGVGVGVFFFVIFSTFGLAFWYGSTLVIAGEVSGSNIMVVFSSVMIGTFAVITIPTSLSAIASAQSSAVEVFAVIDRVPVIDSRQSQGGVTPENFAAKIEFKDIKFSYPTRPNIPILRGLNAEVNSGRTIAFVGPSGSGKSTSISLVQRLYDPTEGSVFIDGIDIKSYNLQWLRRQIGVVGQEPVLFNLTVKQNILLGISKPITTAKLIETCKMANCHNFILNLPNGYDTLVGQSGGMMSGGQKQRIAIARALLKDPKILLLDEATSAFDTASERLVQKALDAASQSRTTIVIAHRLSTIRNADTIVVMDKGFLVEKGNHNSLLELKGVYFGLVEKQKIAKSTELDEEKAEQAARAIEAAEAANKIVAGANQVATTTINMDPDAMIEIETAIELTKLANDRRRAEREQEKDLQKTNSVKMGRVIRMMKRDYHLLGIGIFFSCISGAAFPGYALLLAKLIISFLNPDVSTISPTAFSGANLYCFLFAMIGLGALVGQAVSRTVFARAGANLTRKLRRQLFETFLTQELGFFDMPGNALGVLSSRLATDAEGVSAMVSEAWGEIAALISTFIVGFVISFYYAPGLTGILLTMLPVTAYGSAVRSRSVVGFADSTKKAYEEASTIAAEAIRDVRTVTALVRQDYFYEKYCAALDEPHAKGRVKALRDSLGSATQKASGQISTAIAFGAGVHFIQKGWITFEELFIAMIVTMITSQQVGNSSTFISAIGKGRTAAANLFTYLDRESLINPDAPGIANEEFNPEFEFKDVAFEYPARPDQKIFKGMFNLKGSRNQTIALVGPSGCGKSTTIGMLERWYDASAGVVSVGGINTKDYQLKTGLRKHVALVGQEPILFDMSIRENIAWGIEGEVTDDQIREVAEFANIHKFVDDLPDKYSTRVGDKGGQLSGGQKQRIAIARALIRKPKMLLLDEATSALDSESEKVVQTAIDKAASGRTTVTIAHRLSTIQHADVIAVVSDGVIKEMGKHQELLAMHGIYSDLVKQQDLSVIS